MRVDDLLNCQASRVHTTFSLLKESTPWLSSQEREACFPKGGERRAERSEWILCFDIFTKKCGNCLAPAN